MNDRADPGFIEASQRLLHQDGREWDQRELLRAAKAAELRNTGWPIGVVLTREGLSPTPTVDGIEVRIHLDRNEGGPGWEDYWTFRKDGSFYVARVFEEEFYAPQFQTSEGHPERPLWFDTRIWRIAEVILHSAALYRELGIPQDEPYILSVTHGGLTDREFWTSRAGAGVSRGRSSHTSETTWTREVTQDYVTANLTALVGDVAQRLFVLFDFAEVGDGAVAQIVDDFLKRRL